MVIYLLARERKQPGTFAIATKRSACAIFFAIRDDFFLLCLPPFNLTIIKNSMTQLREWENRAWARILRENGVILIS